MTLIDHLEAAARELSEHVDPDVVDRVIVTDDGYELHADDPGTSGSGTIIKGSGD